MTEPPDISYRELILEDQEGIDRLFEDEGLHFTGRYIKYLEHDLWLISTESLVSIENGSNTW